MKQGDAELLGRSAAMGEIRAGIEQLAETDSTVLITGETGTGKGVAARALHCASGTGEAPWVHVDCAALSASVIESELFGHERGSFTGAFERISGRLEQAAGGTLFLDEIAEIPPPLQAKLLRALQDREFERVGGGRTLRLSARVVAATNQDLGKAVRTGRFRRDLYYRLYVGHLHLPALRDRLEDLPELTHAAVRRGSRLSRTVPRVTEEFLQGLRRHHWPGNVRELFNFVERLLIRSPKELVAADSALALEAKPRAPDLADPWTADDERSAIRAALHAVDGNIAGAARRLGWPRSTLRYRIMIYGMEDQLRGRGPRPRRPRTH